MVNARTAAFAVLRRARIKKCLRENVGMAALAKKQGFEVGAGPTGDTIAMHLDLRE
jgi:hypothetical protein